MSVMNSVQVTYTRAKERGLIKGLNDYNILQNPNYRDAFGVDAKFAAHHRHVTSIRKLKATSIVDDERSSDSDNKPRPPPGVPPPLALTGLRGEEDDRL